MLNQMVMLYLSKNVGFIWHLLLHLGNAFLILQRKSWFQLMLACSNVVEIPAVSSICLTGVTFCLPFLGDKFLGIG